MEGNGGGKFALNFEDSGEIDHRMYASSNGLLQAAKEITHKNKKRMAKELKIARVNPLPDSQGNKEEPFNSFRESGNASISLTKNVYRPYKLEETDYRYGNFINSMIRSLQLFIAGVLIFMSIRFSINNFNHGSDYMHKIYALVCILCGSLIIFFYEISRISPECCGDDLQFFDSFMFSNFGFMFHTLGKALLLVVISLLGFSVNITYWDMISTFTLLDAALLALCSLCYELRVAATTKCIERDIENNQIAATEPNSPPSKLIRS